MLSLRKATFRTLIANQRLHWAGLSRPRIGYEKYWLGWDKTRVRFARRKSLRSSISPKSDRSIRLGLFGGVIGPSISQIRCRLLQVSLVTYLLRKP